MPWFARIAWLVVAVVGGATVESAAADRSAAVAGTTAIGGWTLWAAGALALALPSVWALTLSRVVVPMSLLATIATALAGARAVDVLLLGVPALVATIAVFTAEFGRRYVQASAYGDEERDEGKGSFLTLAHALRLASHPQFSGSIKGLGLAALYCLPVVDAHARDGAKPLFPRSGPYC